MKSPPHLQTALSETDLYSSSQGEGEAFDDNESVHSTHSTDTTSTQDSEFINPKGVRFTQQSMGEGMFTSGEGDIVSGLH